MQKKANSFTPVIRAVLAASLAAAALTACGSTKWGFPYRADVQQGNWITAEQVSRLQTGMTRDQVRYLLGSPTLQDIFHADRWDYPYLNQPGYGKAEQRTFTVWFEGDTLVRWQGDEQPDRQPFERADTGKRRGEAPADANQSTQQFVRPIGGHSSAGGSDDAAPPSTQP